MFVLGGTSAAAEEASDGPESLDEILVFGRATDLVGAADSASEGLVGFDDLSTRPLLRVGELVEVIPGMIATQHSGGGKANQYFLRGMNLDHGTDFSIRFEGMPVNLRTHAHGQGYLDMNFVIPELIRTIEYHKGTYRADVGDFSAASSSSMDTYDRLERGFLQATWGTERYARLVGADSFDAGSGTWLLGAEIRQSDGPWENPENVHLLNLFSKYTTTAAGGDAEFIATWYANDWNATDQVPERAVLSGDIGRYGYVDPSVGGRTHRLNLIASLTRQNTYFQAFVSGYALNLFGNPTYWLNDPVNGDQVEQADDRWIGGGRVDHDRDSRWGGFPVVLSLGTDVRFDGVSTDSLYHTRLRQRTGTVRRDAVDEFSLGAYLSAEVTVADGIRANIGVRADYFGWKVDALRAENSGSGSDVLISPKMGVAWALNDAWEVYLNLGGGFHSNDVRAAELRVDPTTGQPAEPFDAIVGARGIESGFRAEPSDHLNFSATFFYLELDSELTFVGDAGTTEPNAGTKRHGVETTLFWRPADWLVFDVAAAWTDARFSVAEPGQDRIPDTNEIVGSFGATVACPNGLVGSLRVRHFGDAPLVEDNSVRKSGTTLTNLRLSYPVSDIDIALDVLNLFDSAGNDIEYFYESRLFAEPLPVEDIHFHPVEPREFRFSVRYRF